MACIALPCTPKPVLTPLALPACNWTHAQLPLQCGSQPLSLLCLQLEVCRAAPVVRLQATSHFTPCCLQAEKRTFLRQRIDSRLANLYLYTREYQAAIALITKLLTEVGPDLLNKMLTCAPCLTWGALHLARTGPHHHRAARQDADRG